MGQHTSAQRSNGEQNRAVQTSAQFQPRPFAPAVETPIQSNVSNTEDLQAKEETKKGLVHDLTRRFAPPSAPADGTSTHSPHLFTPSPGALQPLNLSPSTVAHIARMGHSAPIQAKLTVGAVGDQYEQEADAVAAEAIAKIHAPPGQQQTQTSTELRKKPLAPVLQRMGKEGGTVPQTIEQQINSAKGGGNPLTPKLQTQMGQAMGADFSNVKIHTDDRSDQLNQSIQAKAFTTGTDIFFRRGEYQPSSKGGQELIAHELTHVVQQSGGTIRRDPAPQQPTTGIKGTGDSIDADLDLLYAEAEAAQGELYKKTIDVANATNGRASLPATLKGRERATEKTKSDYGGDVSKLVDLARGSIIYESYFNLLKGLSACQTTFSIVREKNRFAQPTAAGYRDILLNVQLSNGHIAELQLHLTQILDVKSGVGHKLYEEMRTIQAQADEAKRALTAEEQAKVEKLIAESRMHYDAAFEQSQGG